uniref:O-fucosyltransferase family protein n=1 Tax=Kalanchoe fedtschenkoi TaxID=63787 RepID=A0A7N0VHG0_KALFE
MEAASSSRSKWKKNSPLKRSKFSSLSLLSVFCFLLFFLSYKHIPISRFPSVKSLTLRFPQCDSKTLAGQRFLWYPPHSGFSNQLSEFKNAILMAAILNRTLVVPPVLDHHAVALGSCPKFRVTGPNEIRMAVWNNSIELIRFRRCIYASMADVIDLSEIVSSSLVRMIDFEAFVARWCGLDLNLLCFSGPDNESSLHHQLRQCGSLLSGDHGNVDGCLYAVQDDCRSTVWTYQQDVEDGALDSFQPDEQLRKKKNISYVRRRKDVYNTFRLDSGVDSASVLAFGSLFTAPYKGSESYIDIHEAPKDLRIQSLIEKLEYLPFATGIIKAGKDFAQNAIKDEFLCAQLRLLDGQFKNHWKSTFLALKEKVEMIKKDVPLPINIFVMTDLPERNWSGSYLGDLAKEDRTFKLHVLRENEDVIRRAARSLLDAGHSEKLQSYLHNQDTLQNMIVEVLPEALLYVQEVTCSCASLGFVGTSGSTIAENIEFMRKHGTCSPNNLTKL